jgi:uncharacterized repeat protein (TIGR02543 family)
MTGIKRIRRAVFLAALLGAVLCTGLLAGCKDLFHPDGPEDSDTYYTVTFTAPYGTPSTQTRSVAGGGSVGSNMPGEPGRNGYAFDGWYTLTGGAGSRFTSSTTVTSDRTVYAKWTAEPTDFHTYELLYNHGETWNNYAVSVSDFLPEGFTVRAGDQIEISFLIKTDANLDGFSIGIADWASGISGGSVWVAEDWDSTRSVPADGRFHRCVWTLTAQASGPAGDMPLVIQFAAAVVSAPEITVYIGDVAVTRVSTSAISDITYSSVSGGAWTLLSDGRRRSPAIDDTGVTKARINFTSNVANASITIQLEASSEENYDFAFISGLDNASATYDSGYYERISGENSVTVEVPVPTTGSHFIDIGYRKDGSQNSGSDCAWFKVVQSSGGGEAAVPDTSLQAALAWLDSNAVEGGNYSITVKNNESISPKTLSYSGKNVNIILDGGTAERTVSLSSTGVLFTVDSGVTLTLDNNVTLRGRSSNTVSLVQVNSGGTLVMNAGSTVTGNASYSGGGVDVAGVFTMSGGTISGNTAFTYGGGVYVGSNGTFTMSGGTISGNTAASSYAYGGGGGGVFVYSTFTMNGGTISGNTASSSGGGVYVSSSGTFTKQSGGVIYGSNESDVLKNTATNGDSYGHAVYISSSPAKRRNSTAGQGVTLDSRVSGSSGGWETDEGPSQYTVTFDADGGTIGGSTAYVTRSVNSGGSLGVNMPSDPNKSGYTFGGWYTDRNGGGSQFTSSTAVTSNRTVYAKWNFETSSISDITYSSVSGGAWTLLSDGRRRSPAIGDSGVTKARISFTSNVANASITIQLEASSEENYDFAFISGLDNASATYDSGYYKRISGENSVTVEVPVPTTGSHFIDIGYGKDGSVSSGSDCAWFKVVQSSGGGEVAMPDTSLQAALDWLASNAVEGGNYSITVKNNESFEPQTLSYSGKNVNITLDGGISERTVSLSSTGSLFTVDSGVTLTLGNNVTLRGRSSNTSPLVEVNSGGTLVMNTGSTVTGNTNSGNGGGVFVSSGTLTMNGGTISGNTSTYGGGVDVYNGTFTMSGGAISGNSAGSGGGLYLNGTFTMEDGAINGNSAGSGGGGVHVAHSSVFTMNSGTISGNSADSYGGGVDAIGIFTMSGGTISSNTSTGLGGGVSVWSSGTFIKQSGGVIYGSDASALLKNTATNGDSYGHAVYVDSSPAKRRNSTAGQGVTLDSGVSGSAGGWE